MELLTCAALCRMPIRPVKRQWQSALAASACAVLAALAFLAFSTAQPACDLPGLRLQTRHYAADLSSVRQFPYGLSPNP